jgi:hypothetical protein
MRMPAIRADRGDAARMRSGFLTAVLVFSGLAVSVPATVAAQQVRVIGASTVRYIELRPLQRDSIAEADVAGSGLTRRLDDGTAVRCLPEDMFCRYTRTGARAAAVPLIQDIEASAWGFGQGLRAYAQLRGRQSWGSGAGLWPQAEDPVDVLAAYAELERQRYRVRAGRQWQVSGLGFYNFDGVNAGLAPVTGAWVEAYAGRSLIRGMNESRSGGALESIEALAPPASGLLAGVHARYRPSSRLALGAAYQVDFRNDGAGLFAELAALDGMYRVGSVTVEGSIETDVATQSLNEARLRLRSAPFRSVVVHAQARRYRPYFELWTIWGAFSPIGFDEARAGATWSAARGELVLGGEASYRRYGDAGITEPLDPLRDDGWGAAASVNWAPAPAWHVDAAYRIEGGFGAARRDGHAGIARQLGEMGSISVQALAFQRLYEFRLAEGTVYGLSTELALRVNSRIQLHAGGTVYRHVGGGSAEGLDWNQRRGSMRLQWIVGPEPMAAALPRSTP